MSAGTITRGEMEFDKLVFCNREGGGSCVQFYRANELMLSLPVEGISLVGATDDAITIGPLRGFLPVELTP